VRPGLVTVGVVFLVLAGGALVTVNLLPAASAPQQDQFTLAPTEVAPDGAGATSIPGTASSGAVLTVAWRTPGPLSVDLFPAGRCPSGSRTCNPAGAVATWSGLAGSRWSINGPEQFPYELVWASNSSVPMNFTATATETWNSTATSPIWTAVIVDAVAVALGAVGAVAVFLGLFLRGGVYRGPAPVVSRSAEDVEEIAGRPPKT